MSAGEGYRLEIVDECDGCGADVVEGEPHDCPVLGVRVEIIVDERA